MDSFVIELADAAPLGGKAGILARLIGAGLPVPDGVVVLPAGFAAVAGGAGEVALDDIGHRLDELAAAIDSGVVPPALAVEVEAAAARLAPLAVRSSMSIEDAPGGAAAGVFASRTGVAAGEVWPALRAVWTSAIAPLAVAYARRRGVAGVKVAVIVQRFVAGERVTVYTRPPGRRGDDEVWIAPAHGELRRVRRDSNDPVARLALDAERVIGADAGADVEVVIDGDRRWLVQARPIVHPQPSRAAMPPPPALLAFSAQTPGVTWRLDVGHNPDPLSPAQAGLVDAVVRAGVAAVPLQVVAGYLYVADGDPPPHHRDAGTVVGGPALRVRFDELVAAMSAALPAEPPTDLVGAIAAYLACYRIFAIDVSPLVARARRVLPALLATRVAPDRADALAARLVPRRAGALDAAVVAAARGAISDDALVALAADHAPAWDVAAPTFGERPELVRAAVERVRGALAALIPATPASIDELAAELELTVAELADAVDVALVAATIAEEDDAWFARAQAMVRRALLDTGRRLGLDDPDDACWLPLDDLLAAEAGAPLDPVTARARAGAARAAAARARGWAMPPVVRDGAAVAPADRDDAACWRGAGTGARVVGAVHRIDDLARAAMVPAGAIAVVATVTPALALLLAGARAIVSDHGGVLDHGAAIARELGVPCVVGCTGAWQALRDGELIEVDGDAGRVTRA